MRDISLILSTNVMVRKGLSMWYIAWPACPLLPVQTGSSSSFKSGKRQNHDSFDKCQCYREGPSKWQNVWPVWHLLPVKTGSSSSFKSGGVTLTLLCDLYRCFKLWQLSFYKSIQTSSLFPFGRWIIPLSRWCHDDVNLWFVMTLKYSFLYSVSPLEK